MHVNYFFNLYVYFFSLLIICLSPFLTILSLIKPQLFRETQCTCLSEADPIADPFPQVCTLNSKLDNSQGPHTIGQSSCFQ